MGINVLFFIVELTFGLLSRSMGLTADSLDMLADAFVYGLSLMVVGHHIKYQGRVAYWSGIIQILLALIGLYELIQRFISPDRDPDHLTMVFVAMAALIANATCLYVLRRVDRKQPSAATIDNMPTASACCTSCCSDRTTESGEISMPSTQVSDPYLKASIIFSANDIIINAGVIVAGLLVYLFDSRYPDLVIGGIVFAIILRGSIQILRLAH